MNDYYFMTSSIWSPSKPCHHQLHIHQCDHILGYSVECINRNGLIIHYLLVYEPVDACGNSLATITTVNSGEPDNGGNYMATGLDPSSSYLFKVAAINNIGIGPFSTVQKKGCLLCTHSNMCCFVSLIGVVYKHYIHKILFKESKCLSTYKVLKRFHLKMAHFQLYSYVKKFLLNKILFT